MSILRSELQSCVAIHNQAEAEVEEFRDAVQQCFASDQRFLSGGQVLYFHLRPFVAVEQRDRRAQIFGGLKLFRDFCGSEWVIDTVTILAKPLNVRERIGAACLLRDHNVDVDLTFALHGRFHFLARCGAIAN